MKEVSYFHSQQSISVAGQATEIRMTILAWEEVVRQHNLPNAKLEYLCQQKPFWTMHLVYSRCTDVHKAAHSSRYF